MIMVPVGIVQNFEWQKWEEGLKSRFRNLGYAGTDAREERWLRGVWVPEDPGSPTTALSATKHREVFCPPRRVHKLTEKERKPAGPKGIPWFSQSATRESSRDYKSGERMEPWEYGCLADTSMEQWPGSRERHHKWLISFQMIWQNYKSFGILMPWWGEM